MIDKSATKWLRWLILVPLLFSIAFFVSSLSSLHIPREGKLIPYWFVILYNRFLFPLVGGMLLCPIVFTLILVFAPIGVFTVTAYREGKARVPFLYLAMSGVILLICYVLVCGGSFSSIFIGFSHLASAEFDGRVYHLAETLDLEYESDLALCRCESSGHFCRCDYFYWYRGAFWSADAPPRLVIDSEAGELRVMIDDYAVYAHDGESGRCLVSYPCQDE
jgi:hypothetical protein